MWWRFEMFRLKRQRKKVRGARTRIACAVTPGVASKPVPKLKIIMAVISLLFLIIIPP